MHAVLQRGPDLRPVLIRLVDGAIELGVTSEKGVAIQEHPEKRERRRIVSRNLEIELRKPPGVRAGRIEDANDRPRDAEAPSQTVTDAVAHSLTPCGRRVVSPGGHEKSGNPGTLGLQ